MAQSHDADITLSVGLDTEGVQVAADKLSRSLSKALESVDGRQMTASLERIRQKMEGAVKTTEALKEKLATLPYGTNEKYLTKEYAELNKEFVAIGKEIEKANEELARFAYLASRTKEIQKIEFRRKSAEDEMNAAVKASTREPIGSDAWFDAEEAVKRIKPHLDSLKQREAELKEEAAATSEEYQKQLDVVNALVEKQDAVGAELQRLSEEEVYMIPPEETEEGKEILALQEKLNDQMRIYNLQWEEAIRRQDEMRQKQEDRASRQDSQQSDREFRQGLSDEQRELSGVLGVSRAIGTLIPGVSTSSVNALIRVFKILKRVAALGKEVVAKVVAIGAALAVAGIIITAFIKKVKALCEMVDNVIKKVGELAKATTKLTIDGLMKSLQLAVKILKTVAKVTGDTLKKALTTIYGVVMKVGKGFLYLGQTVTGVTLTAIKSLISKLMSLKSTVWEYWKYMAKWRDGNNMVNKSLSNLVSSLNYVKGSLAAAFVPILTVIEPILTRFLNTLAQVIEMIGMLFAKISGAKSYIRAIRQQEDFADSIDGVGDSAKEAKKQLASYDKLEVIQQDNNSGGGGAGGGVGWEEISLDDFDIDAWLDTLYDKGKQFGEWLRDLLNSIDWDVVKEWAGKFGKGLADFVNGFVEVDGLAVAIGKTVGEVINTITEFFYHFFDNLHFDSVGKFLGDIFMKAINTINFSKLGKTLSMGLNGFFEIVKNFTDRVDGLKVGSKIGSLIESFVTNIEWDKVRGALNGVAYDLATMINGIFGRRTFENLGDAFANFADSLVLGLDTFFSKLDGAHIGRTLDGLFDHIMQGLNWDNLTKMLRDAVHDIAQIFNELVTDDNFGKIGDAFSGILNSITGAINQFVTDVDGADIGSAIQSFISRFLGGLDWTTIEETLTGLATDLGSLLNNLITPETAAQIGTTIQNLFFTIDEAIYRFFKTLDGDQIGEALDTLFDSLLDIDWSTVESTVWMIVSDLVQIFNQLFTPENLTQIGETIGNALNVVISGLHRFIKLANIRDAVSGLIQSLMEFINTFDFAEAGATFGDFAMSVLYGITDALKKVDWNEVAQKINDFLVNIPWGDIADRAQEIGSKLREGLKTVWNTLVDSGVVWDIVDALTTIWNELNLTEQLWKLIKASFKKKTFDAWINHIWTAWKESFTGRLAEGNELIDVMVEMFKNAFDALTGDGSLLEKIKEVGLNIVLGLGAGLLSVVDTLFSPITAIFDAVMGWFRDLFGIHSPSTVMADDIGYNIVAGIAEGLGLFDFFETMQAWWDTNIAPWFTPERWMELAQGIKDGVEAKVEELKAGLTELWTTIKTVLDEKVENIKNSIKEKWEALKSKVTELTENLKKGLSDKWELIKSTIKGKVDTIKSSVLLTFQNLKDGVEQKFTALKDKLINIWDAIKNGIKTPINGILGVVESFVNKVIDGINALISKLNTVSFSGKNPFTGESFDMGFNLSTLDHVSLPRLAQGAVIPPNKEFAAILGDQRSGTNIEAPLDTIVQAFRMALSETGGNNAPIVLQLNGKVVAQAVWDEEEKRYKQTGRTSFA